jgi:subtilase family serine protease
MQGVKKPRSNAMKTPPLSIPAACWALAIALTTALAIPARAQNTGHQVFKDSVPAVVPHLSANGRLPASSRLNLSIGLPLRNESTLDNLLHQLYDPASPNYRHYLTPAQFIEQFAPAAADYQTVADFFGTNGFTVVEHPDRMVLDVNGKVADVERVFHLTMHTYHHPTENRTFFGPDNVPSLDLSVPILHISGLDNYAVKQSKVIRKSSVKRAARAASRVTPRQTGSGSGPDGGYMGKDFRAAYIPGVSLTGANQTVGILEFDTYYSSDLAYYESLTGLSVPVNIVSVDGGVGSPGAGNDEVSLDIDVAMSIAPGLSQIVLYEENPVTNSWDDVLDAMANDTVNAPKQFSCSWGDSSPDVPDLTAENIFKQMDAQGQSFYCASGDGDSFLGGIPFPAESTNIVQAGGTTVTTTGPGGAWIYETVWNWGGAATGDSSIGGSGGVSDNFSIPYWQAGVSTGANGGSPTMRNVPDVAMVADNVFIEGDEGSDETVGGTSCAAPAWAAFTALANQQAAAAGKKSVGFAAPAIYAAGESAKYLADFNDITTGNNCWAFNVNSFFAVPGYDLCTGWGTPSGDNLIDLLAGTGDSLAVAPGRGFVAFGPAQGAFTANTLTFSLTNSSAGSLNWSLINTSSWLTASSSGGALAAHGIAQATVSLNAAANALPAGTYTAGVLFSNQTTHAVRTREFVLVAGQNLVQNGDFENYPYSLPDWAQSGGIGMYNETPYPNFNYDYVDDGTYTGYNPYSGTQFCAFQTAGTVGYISQNIPTVPGQSYVLSFWLMNATNGTVQRFVVNWNASNGPTNNIYNLLNPPPFDWSNIVLYVTATSTNTVLQLGGRADASQTDFLGLSLNLFGLDDVTLMAISNPSLNLTISKAGPNTVVLTWNSVVDQSYDVQYTTSLVSPNWINLGTNTATGPTLSLTNNIGSPWGFYRVIPQ